ncbi:MAG TPA: carbamoyltransferase C-terminal domain-containing protein, partial [Candidatus Paceibacterota bacterium]|nr:carbamoyltransferase C-terminal domain-containing protein [Candidatus Paceibacterota bacterium]
LFSFRAGGRMWSGAMEALLGASRKPEEPIEERHKNIAAALQQLLEKAVLKTVKHAYNLTGQEHLCMGGGVALNAVANGKVILEGPFKRVHIWGAAGDSGAAAGAALLRDAVERSGAHKEPATLLLGSCATAEEIDAAIDAAGVSSSEVIDENMALYTAKLLQRGDIVARFSGAMEFGPRALGNRSLIAHPGLASAMERLQAIKQRESFRPFGALCFEDRFAEYISKPLSYAQYPYMNVCLPVKPTVKEKLQNVVHVDGTCRVQTLARDPSEKLSRILASFEELTGIPFILNTSFNKRGEPLVESPAQAIELFKNSSIDHLLIGGRLLSK